MSRQILNYLYDHSAFSSMGAKVEHKEIFREFFDSFPSYIQRSFPEKLLNAYSSKNKKVIFIFKFLLETSAAIEEEVAIPLDFYPNTNVFTEEASQMRSYEDNESAKVHYVVALFLFLLYELNTYESYLPYFRE